MPLLEREEPLAVLSGALEEAVAGHGVLAVVSGEAGIGKTSLVRAFTARARPVARILEGACDDLSVPRPLGPFLDIAAGAGAPLRDALRSGDRADAFGAVLDELGARGATVCVIEDAHWADEASIDVVAFVARRIASVPALLLVTVRDDDLGPDHPLRRALGAAPAGHVRRIALPRLSATAVAALAGSAGAGRSLYAATGGNPFFVTEALSAGLDATPAGVRDAVLARAARLSDPARAALELVSVVPARAEVGLVRACTTDADTALAECEERGLLAGDGAHVAFRHELARRAVEESLPGLRRAALHRAVLDALERGGADAARLAHHAAGAGDPEAITAHGLDAARAAVRAASHQEAAELFALVLDRGVPLPDGERVEVLERCSEEAYYAGQADRALEMRLASLVLRRAAGEPHAVSAGLRWLSRVRWWTGDRAGAEAAGDEAIALVEGLPPSRELAMAESNRAQLLMLGQRDEEAIAVGRRAMALARELGDVETLVHAQTNVGTSLQRDDFAAGQALLEEAIVIGRDAGLDEHVCRAMVNAAWDASTQLPVAQARALAVRGLTFAEDREQPGFAGYMRALIAHMDLASGDWDAAEAMAAAFLAEPDARMVVGRIPALQVTGLVALRRGLPGARETLDEAWRLASETGELQRLRPVACARAEAAWLAGDDAGVLEATGAVLGLALERDDGWGLGEVLLWRRRAGAPEAPPRPCIPAFALELAGDHLGAAAEWDRLGWPYRRALTLLFAGSPETVREAVAILDGLGAVPVAARARAALRALGETAIPRGPNAATRANPAGLSARQMEVALLVARGLTNARIAEELVLSDRTVEHHVAAVLQKLGVASRGGVGPALEALGVAPA